MADLVSRQMLLFQDFLGISVNAIGDLILMLLASFSSVLCPIQLKPRPEA